MTQIPRKRRLSGRSRPATAGSHVRRSTPICAESGTRIRVVPLGRRSWFPRLCAAVAGMTGARRSAKEIRQRDLPAWYGIAEIEDVVAAVNADPLLSPVRRHRPLSGLENEHQPRARLQPAKRLCLYVRKCVAWRDDLGGKVRCARPILLVRPTASPRSVVTNAASGARTVSGSRARRKPVSAAKVTPAPVSRA
jgi:hypothetical protein